MCILDYIQYFLLPLKKLADDQCSSITKGNSKDMYIRPISMKVDWCEIGCLMEVSTKVY